MLKTLIILFLLLFYLVKEKKGQREFDSSVVYNDNPYIYICVPIKYVIKSLFL